MKIVVSREVDILFAFVRQSERRLIENTFGRTKFGNVSLVVRKLMNICNTHWPVLQINLLSVPSYPLKSAFDILAVLEDALWYLFLKNNRLGMPITFQTKVRLLNHLLHSKYRKAIWNINFAFHNSERALISRFLKMCFQLESVILNCRSQLLFNLFLISLFNFVLDFEICLVIVFALRFLELLLQIVMVIKILDFLHNSIRPRFLIENALVYT